MTKNLHTKGVHPAKDKIKFNLVGNVRDYNFKVTPTTVGRITNARVQFKEKSK